MSKKTTIDEKTLTTYEKRGYQPTNGNLDINNPPQGGSALPSNPSGNTNEPNTAPSLATLLLTSVSLT